MTAVPDVDRAADRPLRADHAAGRARRRHRATGGRSSSCSRAGCPRAAGTASWPASAARSTRSSGSGSTTRCSTCSASTASSTSRRWSWLADYRFSGDIWGYAEGETYFPYSPLVVVESTFAEAVLLETLLLSILNHDSAIASAASRMTLGRRRPAVHRDGLAPHPRGGGGRGRPRGVRRRLRRPPPTSRPGSGTASRRPAPARTASRCCTTPSSDAFRAQVDVARQGHDAAGRHLRRRRGGAARGRGRRPGARRGPPRLRRPRRARAARSAQQLDALGATGTRIVVTSDLDEYAIAALAAAPVDGYGVGTSLVTGSGAPDLRASSTSWSPARTTDGRDGRRRQEEQGQDLGRRAQVRPAPARRATASPRPRWSASARRRSDDGDDRPLLVPLVRDGEVVGREPPRRGPRAAPPRPRRAADDGPPAVAGRRRSRPVISESVPSVHAATAPTESLRVA